MEAVNLIGSPKTQTTQNYDEWDTSHVASMVFDACSNGSGVVKSAEIIAYVRNNWVHKESDIKQADDQLRRLLICLDPAASNEGLQFSEFQEKFSVWVESEQSKDMYSRSPKIDTYETECDDNTTIESSTTESLLSWDYPPMNGYDHNSLKKENQSLKEQISTAEVYNTDLVDEVRDLTLRLKNINETKSDLDTAVEDQNSEISTLRCEINEWRECAKLYKTSLQKLESQVKREAVLNESDDSSGVYLPSNTNEYITRDTHDSQILECKKTIAELKEHIAFLKKENEVLDCHVNQLSAAQHMRSNGDDHSAEEELKEDPYRPEEFEDFSQEQFLSEEQIAVLLDDEGEGGEGEVLLYSFTSPHSLDDFSNLITSTAKQLNRVLRSLPPTVSAELVPRAERQLFTDTLHQMTASKHLSEIKIAQLVDLFRRLKVEHRKLGDEHVCLRSDYENILAEYEEMKAEIVSITRTNAQLRNEVVTVYESAQLTPPSTPQSSATMQRRDDTLLKQEIDDLKKKLKGAEKANLTLTLAIEEQTKQRNALQENIDELQNALNASINTISRIEYENKTLTRDNEKLAETYTRQRGDLDELRKEWVAEMDRCTTLESGYNSLNQTIVESIRSVVKLLKPAISFTSFDPSVCLPLEDWTTFLNNEFLGATKVVEEIRLNGGSITTTGSDVILPKKSTEVQTDPITFTTDSSMKGNLARSSCFEESRSYSDTSTAPNGGVKAALPAAKPSSATTNGGAAVAVVEEPVQSSDKEDITTEFQFTTDVAALSKRSIEGEFQAIILSFENDTFTLQKRLTMHDRALQKASTSFKTEVDKIQELLTALKSDFLPEDKKRQAEDLSRTLSLLPETVETLTNSSLATGKCQQEEKNVRHFEVMVAHNFHTKKALTGALALCNTNTDLGMPKKDVDRAAVRKKTLAVAAAMRKDEEKQKQMQASEHSSVFSSFAGVVKNLMVKTPAEPDLANRRATEMMQRMKTVETLGADKEALYKEGYRGGLSSGLHDTFDNIKKEQRSCDEGVDSLNKRQNPDSSRKQSVVLSEVDVENLDTPTINRHFDEIDQLLMLDFD
ncbi:myosin-13-like isoform X2 [Bolinopsis microptera]|uniref:myosin-13-like isoform X2 n=1 Tax=Bolinopsis microptera TaxID=2820187 RepID=UPI00307A1F8F